MTVARKCSATPRALLAVGGPGITASTTLTIPTRATLFTWKNRSLCVCVCVCVCNICVHVCVVVMCGWSVPVFGFMCTDVCMCVFCLCVCVMCACFRVYFRTICCNKFKARSVRQGLVCCKGRAGISRCVKPKALAGLPFFLSP